MKKMILRIVLFLSYGILVSSNNGYPIIPTQTYPIYQQNGYTNPSTNQPSDITPYLHNSMVQNQSPSMNLSPSNIRQILLNRILSNQPIQSIFDQNSIGYGANLVEYPYNPVVANPVSNYVNISPTGANKEDNTAVSKTEEALKKTKKRKVSKSKRRKHDESENNKNTSRKSEVNDIKENEREIRKKTKKRSRKPKTEDSLDENHTKNSENESNKKIKKKKRKNKRIEEKKSIEETPVENPKPRRRRKKKQKVDEDNTEKVIAEPQTTLKLNQIQEGINLAHFDEGIVEENRVPRNPIPEENKLLKSIPNLPENIANSFHFKGLPQFNNPVMSSFFGNYENLYQSMIANNKGTNNQREIIRRRPQKSRNNSKINTEVKNKNSTSTTKATALTNSKPTVIPKINVVTTEKTIYIKEKTHTDIDPAPKEESLNFSDKPFDVNETTILEYENEEFGVNNDDIKDMNDNYSHGYIEDYYPQFTDSAAYTANNREVYIKNLGDTKYYYAIDKGNPDFINRMRFEGFGPPKSVVKDYEVNKKYDNLERENAKNASYTDFKDIKEEEVKFRSPPHLEIPDFQTRQVGWSEINPETYSHFDENSDFYKASIYSEAKIPHYTGTKENSKKSLKDRNKDVETVFAKSKVANYGPVYNPKEEPTSTGISNQVSTEDSYFKDGGTTYVLATSVDYPDSTW